MGVTIEVDGWDPTRKYCGGDLLQGSVIFNNNSGRSKLLNEDLVIKFIGKADSHWKEQRRNTSHFRQYLITVFEDECYFEDTIVLQNRDSSIHNRDIKPGRTEYPFYFQLPMGLPESFKSDHGSVSYFMEVPYPKPWALDNSVKLEFLVGAHLDLNSCPREWSQPGQFTMQKKFWLGMGRVEAQLSLPTRAFVPLDNINFTLEVINDSRYYLKKIRVYFCQVTMYRAKGSEFKEGARLTKIKCKSVFPRGTATIQGAIAVPDVPPTELGGCNLVQPQYGIMIKVIATTFGKIVKSVVLEGRVPIIIGTVPIGRIITPAPNNATFIRPSNSLELTTQFSSRILPPKNEAFNNLGPD